MEKSNRDTMINELNETTDKKRIKELKTALSSVVVKQRGRRGFKVDDNLVRQEELVDGRFLIFCTDQRISAKNIFMIYFQLGNQLNIRLRALFVLLYVPIVLFVVCKSELIADNQPTGSPYLAAISMNASLRYRILFHPMP